MQEPNILNMFYILRRSRRWFRCLQSYL